MFSLKEVSKKMLRMANSKIGIENYSDLILYAYLRKKSCLPSDIHKSKHNGSFQTIVGCLRSNGLRV